MLYEITKDWGLNDVAEGESGGGCVVNQSMIYCVWGILLKEDRSCMRDLVVQFVCVVKNSERLRRDCGLVIRSRGRWGKCG